jgi:valyl-tRNA synthetase
MKIGRRLAIKILNASKFALGRLEGGEIPRLDAVTEPIDLDILAELRRLVEETTKAFAEYDYARALERTEQFFWAFCDDYIELVKVRAYDLERPEANASARAALALVLSALQRLFAPFLPFVTEEVWSWWHEGSVHRAPWPRSDEFGTSAPNGVFGAARDVLGAVRREKTEAKVGMRAVVESAVISGSDERLNQIRAAQSDIADAGSITNFVFTNGDDKVDVTLAASE